jgi:hypothetical protein
VGVRKIKGKSLNVTVPKHERQTLFTWTAAKLKHHGRNGQVLAWSKQKSAIQREEKVSQPNDQRMPIKKTKEERLGPIPADPFAANNNQRPKDNSRVPP